MTGSACRHIANAVHLRYWSRTGSGGACPSAVKMLRSGLRPPGQGRHRRSSAGSTTPQHLADILAQRCQHNFPMTKTTPKML